MPPHQTATDRRHAALSPLDDYLIHQAPHPIATTATSDPRAYERYWNLVWDADGELFIAVGGGVYPNLAAADAFVIVNHRGRHYSLRAGGPRPGDPADLSVGPFRPVIEEGLRAWRFELPANDYCPSFDFTWTDIKRMPFRGPSDPKYAGGTDDVSVTAGFESFGVVEGWIDLDGRRVPLSGGRYRGTRDRHWGTRLGVGGPALLLGRPAPRGRLGFVFADFGSWCVWGDQVLLGDDLAPARVVSMTRRLRFEEDTAIFASGVIELALSDGSARQLELAKLGQQGAYLRCGGYGGPNGAAPGSERWHGVVGDGYAEGGLHDLADPATRVSISGLNEHHCRISSEGQVTTGIFQSYDPAALHRCQLQVPGWQLL